MSMGPRFIGHPSASDCQRGFTLIEMMVSMAIMLIVLAGVFTVFNPAQGAFQSQPEAADMQQRLRIGVTEMSQNLMMAGAGTYRSATSGPLTNVMAAVLPYRLGTTSPDPAGNVFFRTDTITVVFVPGEGAESSLSAPIGSTTADLPIVTGAGCPPAQPACGFQTGDRALLFDQAGGFDTFSITGVTAAPALQHGADALSKTYTAGARVAEIEMHTYYLRGDPATSTYQLMHFDGYRTDDPLVDNVVGLRFDYLGDPAPPVMVHNAADPEGPWTTYGPKPPMVGVDNPADSWPAGENCTFAVVGGQHVSRLASLGAGSVVPLTQAQLSDGPWCPDGASRNRFDADLLRIRKVRITMRVQTGNVALRGSGALFTRPGAGKDGGRLVPDQEIRFDVTPRNMNLNR